MKANVITLKVRAYGEVFFIHCKTWQEYNSVKNILHKEWLDFKTALDVPVQSMEIDASQWLKEY